MYVKVLFYEITTRRKKWGKRKTPIQTDYMYITHIANNFRLFFMP